MNTAPTTSRQLTFRVRRFDPDTGSAPHWDSYTVNVAEGMTVLEALHQIKAEKEPTLAWRSSCRMGVCGSCGMFINDLPRLACQTQVFTLGTNVITSHHSQIIRMSKILSPIWSHLSRNMRRSSRLSFIQIHRKWTSPRGNFCRQQRNVKRSASSHTV